jgi:CRISPR-associated protein Cmx8
MSKLEEYEINYQLNGLPTLQHKAGLGGLVFLLDYIRDRDDIPDIEKIDYEAKGESLKTTLTPASLQRLFDELYSSLAVTQTTKSKPKGDYTEHERSGAGGKTERVFQYQDDRPKGPWLYERLKPQTADAIPVGEDLWHKLWQDSLWQTFRGIPATRKVFTGSKNKVVKEFWAAFEKSNAGNPVALEIASTIYVGAQSKSPEGIGFDGSPNEVFLLHFAQVLAQPYKVVGVDSQGKTNWPGVIWVFPEPGNLNFFVSDCKSFLKNKTAQDPLFRERSRVTLPQEAALCLMTDEALHLALKDTGEMGIKGALCTQLIKEGNNINLLAASYVPRNQKLLNGYKEIVSGVKSYPLRHLLLTNLLKGRPLYKGAAKLLSYLPKDAALPQSGLGYTISRDSKFLLEHTKV